MVDHTNKASFSRIDWVLVLLFIVMVGWGWLNIFSTEFITEKGFKLIDFSHNYGRQMFWIIISASLAFFILLIDVRFFTTFAYVIFGAIILILLVVLGIGTEISGSKSWLIITDSIRFQPSELAKVGVALALAKYLNKTGVSLQNRKHQLYAVAIIVIPALLILLQKDTGTSLVFIAFFLVFYREGWPTLLYLAVLWIIVLFILTLLVNNYLLIGIIFVLMFILTGLFRKNRRLVYTMLLVAVFSSLFVTSVDYIFDKVLRPHQKDRIMILIGKEVDPRGIGYNINQSLIAIGSGGFTGKGFMKGTQTKFNFVPEQSTDFIFCTIGEEWGFLGSLAIIGMFLLMLVRIILLSEKQRSDFARIYGYALASVLFFHFLINIAMTINLLPVIGIPLPFFSYGGSSLMSFTIFLFIFIRLNSKRNDVL
jgi:rod shape determining protein RodA